MRALLLLATCIFLAGCSTRPPLPPDCEGALTPINRPVTAVLTTPGPTHESRTTP